VATVSWDKNTGSGASSNYYGAPRRNWSWDASFANGLTPPGMPRSWQATMGRWVLLTAEEFEDAGGTSLRI
jgi:hypothetical protein